MTFASAKQEQQKRDAMRDGALLRDDVAALRARVEQVIAPIPQWDRAVREHERADGERDRAVQSAGLGSQSA